MNQNSGVPVFAIIMYICITTCAAAIYAGNQQHEQAGKAARSNSEQTLISSLCTVRLIMRVAPASCYTGHRQVNCVDPSLVLISPDAAVDSVF